MPNRPGGYRTSGLAITAAERQAQALEYRKMGWTHAHIAKHLGYASQSGAQKAVETALRRTIQEPADALRTLELERLDVLMSGVWPRASIGDPRSIVAALNIMRRRAALLGLDAPKKIEHSGEINVRQIAAEIAAEFGRPVDEVVAEAEAIVREAQR